MADTISQRSAVPIMYYSNISQTVAHAHSCSMSRCVMAYSVVNLHHLCRGQIAGTIVSYKRGWPADLTFTADLVSKLITDMSSLASEPETRSFKLLKPLLGFSACIAAICRACAEANTQIFTGATFCNLSDSAYSDVRKDTTR